MGKEIILRIMSREHMTKQPLGKRYALFCHDTLDSIDVGCESKSRLGYLDDFETYKEAKEIGIRHSHSIEIQFYPITDNPEPTNDFLKDFEEQPQIGYV